jgi:hypothetical protein
MGCFGFSENRPEALPLEPKADLRDSALSTPDASTEMRRRRFRGGLGCLEVSILA